MPTGSVKLQSIKKLGQENRSYEASDEGDEDTTTSIYLEFIKIIPRLFLCLQDRPAPTCKYSTSYRGVCGLGGGRRPDKLKERHNTLFNKCVSSFADAAAPLDK